MAGSFISILNDVTFNPINGTTGTGTITYVPGPLSGLSANIL